MPISQETLSSELTITPLSRLNRLKSSENFHFRVFVFSITLSILPLIIIGDFLTHLLIDSSSIYLIFPMFLLIFSLGLFTFGIANEMYYDFSLFLLVLLMFYSFLILLHIFYYVPFSTRPEHMFNLMRKRLFLLSQKLFEYIRSRYGGKYSVLLKLAAVYSRMHLNSTIKKIELWSHGIDKNYFDGIDEQKLLLFTKASGKFSYLVELLYDRESQMKDNPLLKILGKSNDLPYFSDLLAIYAKETKPEMIDSFWKDTSIIEKSVGAKLSEVFEKIDLKLYKRKDIATLYEVLSLRRSVWLAFFDIQRVMEDIDFNVLKQSRF